VRQQKHIKAAITAIPEQDWQTLPDYPKGGEAQISQTMLGRQRLIVRSTRPPRRPGRSVARLALSREAVAQTKPLV
jgi:hypothetical protein